MRILVINGPNLNLLGTREPHIYGTATLADLEGEWRRCATANAATLESFKSNDEGAIVDTIPGAIDRFDGLINNAGALTHYSYSLRDAVAASGITTVEVHISNIYEREEWRHNSVLSDVCNLTIVGRGTDGYLNAIDHLVAVKKMPPITAAYASHPDALLELRTPSGDGPHPVALLIHGGFWRHIWKRDLMDPMATSLTELGWATVNMEYTRGPNSYRLAMADTAAAVQWIRDNSDVHGLDAGRIVAIGHSAGGYLALRLAHDRSDIAACVPLAAVSSLRAVSDSRLDDDPVADFLGATRAEAPRLWDQAELMGAPAMPVNVIHGSEDETVPASQSETYAALKTAVSATIVDGGDHMDVIDPTSASWPAVVAALEAVRS
jgi:3-dehydroquinate dehydratase type II